ncbi:MAG: hypothetical protein M1835_004600 [Candelina submexicana]|nr:MAG: hypothetical protein M1835_004600 [Candelina submexicana]
MGSTVGPSPGATAVTSPYVMRRAFTLPTRLTESPNAGKPTRREAEGIEILFAHTSGKIVSFSPNSSTSRPNSSSGQASRDREDAVGTLPWASPTERTIAAGPLRIYSVPGSVAFLNSGTTLHPILAKSQCWCVDGETIFVLRIRPGSYYRIELPNNVEEDSRVADELKGVLAKVLQYETTPCPFNRNFTVDLPMPPKVPIRKRPWKPFERPKVDRVRNVEENEDTDEYLTAVSDNDSTSDTEDGRHINVMEGIAMPQDTDVFSTPTRPKGPAAMTRSITAPARTARESRNSESSSPLYRICSNSNGASSLSSSVDSFQSFYSTRSPLLPPSPPYSNPPSPPLNLSDTHQDIDLPRRRQHERDVSEITITPGALIPGTTKTLEDSPTSLPPTTPTPMGDSEDMAGENWSLVKTPTQSSELRHRRPTTSRQRALSPLPSPANVFSPSAHRSGHRLATAVLQKTCSLIAGPLISLMLRIASCIADGAVKGVAFGYGDKGEKIPCQWDYSEGNDGEANLDDYGVPLRAMSASSVKAAERDGSWEVD